MGKKTESLGALRAFDIASPRLSAGVFSRNLTNMVISMKNTVSAITVTRQASAKLRICFSSSILLSINFFSANSAAIVMQVNTRFSMMLSEL